MSWKFVFNSNWAGCQMFSDAKELTRRSGYQFFTWNGVVYTLDGELTYIEVKDLY